jgi:EmrB/QacA subfamily drug resistance transporter
VSTRAVFVTVATAVFVSYLDLFVVNIALPYIGRDFHGTSLASLSWVLNAYAIVFAALLVMAGRIADRNGHRYLFLIGICVFTAGSALCAASTDVGWLIGSRVVQATGAAIMLPTSLALLLATTPSHQRARAVAAWGAVGGVAAALGPVLGGLLVQVNWRWVFLINVPVGIVAIVAGRRVLPEVRPDGAGRWPDFVGAVLLTISIAALSLSLVKGDDWGWSAPRTVGGFVAAFVLLLAFVFRSNRHPVPVLELQLLRVRAFSVATVAASLFTVAFAAVILSMVLWCEDVWRFSALKTGLALAPGPLALPPVAMLSGPLARRIGNGTVAALGNLMFGCGVLSWLFLVGIVPRYAPEVLPGLLITGIGVGLALPTLISASATALPPQRFATGSGILNMARQIGAVLGVAVLVSVLGAARSPSTALIAFRHGWDAVVAVSALAVLASLLLLRRDRPSVTANAPPPGLSGQGASTQSSRPV